MNFSQIKILIRQDSFFLRFVFKSQQIKRVPFENQPIDQNLRKTFFSAEIQSDV